MLILKPIQLHTSTPMLTIPEDFHQKILGNYGLIGTGFEPKDLLYLTTTPPEFPEDMGGVTNLAVSTNIRNNEQVILEVVNNVVNRILLADQANFTYQDSVYVTSVLQKLGITDVNEFIRQVYLLREENKNVAQLLKLYESNLNLLLPKEREEEEKRPEAGDGETKTEPGRTPGARYYIHNEIYRRLGTSTIYELVGRAAAGSVHTINTLTNRELLTSEQSRVSNILRLAELKSRTVFRDSVALQHHINHYELGDLLPPPATEKELLSSAAAAVLLNLVDKVMVSRMEQVFNNSHFWLDISNALTKTAENSLSRFEYYHSSADYRSLRREVNYAEQLNRLYKDETEILNRLFYQLREGDRVHIHPPGESAPPQRLTLEQRFTEEKSEESVLQVEGETKTSTLSREAVIDATRSILERAPSSEVRRPVIPPPPGTESYFSEKERLELLHLKTSETEVLKESSSESERLTERETQTHTRSTERAGERQSIFRDTLLSRESEETIAREIAKAEQERKTPPVPMENVVLEHRAGDIYETTEEQRAAARDTVRESKVLKEQLERIREQFRERSESIVAGEPERIRGQSPAPEQKQALAEILRSLGEPEPVVTRILAALEPVDISHRRPPELEEILSRTDEETRRTIETVLQYRPEERRLPERELLRSIGAAEAPEPAAVAKQPPPETLVFDIRGGDTYETTEEIEKSTRDTVRESQLLKMRLDELNERNRELFERYQTERLERIREQAATPDRKRAFADALRAMGEPDKVIAEMLSSPEPAAMQHRRSPALEALLGGMDEKTRQIYETVLLYQENPQAALEKGLLRPASVGAFNAESAAISAPESMELTHREQGSEDESEPELTGAYGTSVVEKYLERRTTQEESTVWNRLPSVRTVLRQPEPSITEELLESLENRRKKEVKTVEEREKVINRTVSQTELNEIRQEVINRSTEDITEIINRAMAKQIGAITDRVYSQMERRLENERIRRGRFF